jgi:hypothetical protein
MRIKSEHIWLVLQTERDWKQTWCDWSWLKWIMVQLVVIESKHGMITRDWKQSGLFGHTLASISIQQSSNGVWWTNWILLGSERLWVWVFVRIPSIMRHFGALLVDMSHARSKDLTKWQIFKSLLILSSLSSSVWGGKCTLISLNNSQINCQKICLDHNEFLGTLKFSQNQNSMIFSVAIFQTWHEFSEKYCEH